ncbi:MAG: DsbA family protein [Pseudomonadota bacterium]
MIGLTPLSRALAESAAGPVTGDVILGADDAPVTVYEYASLTCPHCAAFHRDTFPEIKAQYVETGKVKFIVREVFFDRYGLWAAMVARCGGERAYYPLIDAYLVRQREWTGAQDVAAEIRRIGLGAGLSPSAMDACLADEDLARGLVARYQETSEEHEVNSTPTFIINGTRHRGNMSFEEMAAIFDSELAS